MNVKRIGVLKTNIKAVHCFGVYSGCSYRQTQTLHLWTGAALMHGCTVLEIIYLLVFHFYGTYFDIKTVNCTCVVSFQSNSIVEAHRGNTLILVNVIDILKSLCVNDNVCSDTLLYVSGFVILHRSCTACSF